MKLDEPSEDDTIVMMRGLKDKYEQAHGIRILDEGIVAAARLSSRYIAGRQLPDKAVDLLDTAAARVKIGRATRPEPVDMLERKMQAHQREREALIGDARMRAMSSGDRVSELDTELAQLATERDVLMKRFGLEQAAVNKVLALRGKVEAAAKAGTEMPPQSELDAALAEMTVTQGETPLVPLDVDARLVAGVVESWTGIPVGKMAQDEATSILQFKARVAERSIDLGFIEGDSHLPSLATDVCCADELRVVCAPAHPLAKHTAVAPKALAEHAYISREPGSGTRQVIDHYLQKSGVLPESLQMVMELGSPEALKGLVATGLGYAIMSRSTVAKETKLGQLVEVPLAPRLLRNLSVVYTRERYHSLLVSTFTEFAKERLRASQVADAALEQR